MQQSESTQHSSAESTHVPHPSGHGGCFPWIRVIISWIHIPLALTCMILSIVCLVAVLNENNNKAFIVNTYYSSPSVDLGAGWPVSTVRQSSVEATTLTTKTTNWSWNHYTDCMATAAVGPQACVNLLPGVAPVTTTFNDYFNCLYTNNLSKTLLTQCNVYSSAYFNDFPTAEQYVRCLDNPAGTMQFNRSNRNIFRSCLHTSLWPFFETPQGVDSDIFLGSFHWGLILVVGFWCMTGFAVYTISPFESGWVFNGHPSAIMRMGLLSVAFCIMWYLFITFFSFVLVFRGSLMNQLALTVSTTSLILVYVVLILFYFILKLSGITWKAATDRHVNNKGFDRIKQAGRHFAKQYRKIHPQNAALYAMLPKDIVEFEKDSALVDGGYLLAEVDAVYYYGKGLLSTWSDAYLTDPLILLGIAGATGQLSTDLAWNLFTLCLIYRVLNMILSRYMYESFCRNPVESADLSTAKGKRIPLYTGRASEVDPLFNMKLMALSTQLAVLLVILPLYMIVFDPDNGLKNVTNVQLFFIFGFIIPEIIRFIMHLACQFLHMSDWASTLLTCGEFLWVWDLLIRLIFVSIVVLQGDTTQLGTKAFATNTVSTLFQTVIPAVAF